MSEVFTVVSHTNDTYGLAVHHLEAENSTDAMVQAQSRLEYQERQVTEQTCFLGRQDELDPNESEFDYEAHSIKVNEEEKQLVSRIVSGELSDRLAVMTGFFDRIPVHLIASVYQTEEDFLITPLFVRLNDDLMHHLRSPDGDPVGAMVDATDADG